MMLGDGKRARIFGREIGFLGENRDARITGATG
jgi:hypothetical protein